MSPRTRLAPSSYIDCQPLRLVMLGDGDAHAVVSVILLCCCVAAMLRRLGTHKRVPAWISTGKRCQTAPPSPTSTTAPAIRPQNANSNRSMPQGVWNIVVKKVQASRVDPDSAYMYRSEQNH
jgi:hypothetical protein